MRNVIAIFLLFQILTNNTFVEDIFRVPTLIEHYFHHQDESPELSLIDFLSIHYSNEASAEDTDSTHHSFPLKHSKDVGHVHTAPVFTLPNLQSGFSIIPSEVEHHTSYPYFIPNHNLEAIFQPPKSC